MNTITSNENEEKNGHLISQGKFLIVIETEDIGKAKKIMPVISIDISEGRLVHLHADINSQVLFVKTMLAQL